MCLHIFLVAQDEARMLTTGRTLRETAELCRKNKTYPAKNELPKMLKAYNPVSLVNSHSCITKTFISYSN